MLCLSTHLILDVNTRPAGNRLSLIETLNDGEALREEYNPYITCILLTF